jgi:hypothetical protein
MQSRVVGTLPVSRPISALCAWAEQLAAFGPGDIDGGRQSSLRAGPSGFSTNEA